MGGFESEKTSFFPLKRQILQPKSGISGEKFNEARRKKGFFIAKSSHRNKSNYYRSKTVGKPSCDSNLQGGFPFNV